MSIDLIFSIAISSAIGVIAYVCIFMKPDHTPHPSRKTTGDDILFPGNPAMITSLDQLKPFTLEELAKYSGKEGGPIYISIGGKVFDCSAGVGFYGPGGAYELFAGRDISLAAAKFSKEEKYLDSPDLTNITPAEKDSFFHFYNMLYGKYPMIGTLLGSTYSQQLSQQKARQAKVVPPYAHLSKS